jgi:hypothetical protein
MPEVNLGNQQKFYKVAYSEKLDSLVLMKNVMGAGEWREMRLEGPLNGFMNPNSKG